MKNSSLYLKLGAVAAMAILLAVLFFHSKRQDDAFEQPGRTLIPAVGPISARPRAPELIFELEDSSKLPVASLHGKVVHLVFWAEWCEPCRREFAVLQKIANEKGQNYKIILINLDEDEDGRNSARALLKEKAIALTAVYRDTRKISELLKIEALPYHSILDKEGRIAATFISGIDDDLPAFNKLLDGLLKE